MICPTMSYRLDRSSITVECKGEKCAWWNRDEKCCSVVSIANNSKPIAEAAEGHRTLFIRSY